MTEHIWDGRKFGKGRRQYKIAGCARGLMPRQRNVGYRDGGIASVLYQDDEEFGLHEDVETDNGYEVRPYITREELNDWVRDTLPPEGN